MRDPITVLVVDDSELVRSSIRTMLELEGDFRVVGEAATGEEAVAAATRLRPDVVLMDINMPGMDGIQATQILRERLGVPVVVISVQGEAEYRRRALAAGAREYLIKPFTMEELAAAVRRAARAEPPGHRPPAQRSPE